MFSDPFPVTLSGTAHSLARIRLDQNGATYRKVLSDGSVLTLLVRNDLKPGQRLGPGDRRRFNVSLKHEVVADNPLLTGGKLQNFAIVNQTIDLPGLPGLYSDASAAALEAALAGVVDETNFTSRQITGEV